MLELAASLNFLGAKKLLGKKLLSHAVGAIEVPECKYFTGRLSK